jgi:pimeloyl-ACP methyl ester carboxylesterase
MGAKVSATFLAAYPTRVRSIVLGGYGWPWRTSRQTIEQANERLKTRTVLPGNDIQALAAVSVGMYDLTPSESVLKSNQVPAIAIIGDNDAAVPVTDRDTLAETMANLELVIIPGTHAGPDGAPYKPVYVEKMLGFLDNQ